MFPESPRWLLLSERSADMNSFSERRNSNRDLRDDESFTGESAHTLVTIFIFFLEVRAAYIFSSLPDWMDIQSMKPALFMFFFYNVLHFKTWVPITQHYQEQVMMLNSWFIKDMRFLYQKWNYNRASWPAATKSELDIHWALHQFICKYAFQEVEFAHVWWYQHWLV